MHDWLLTGQPVLIACLIPLFLMGIIVVMQISSKKADLGDRKLLGLFPLQGTLQLLPILCLLAAFVFVPNVLIVQAALEIRQDRKAFAEGKTTLLEAIYEFSDLEGEYPAKLEDLKLVGLETIPTALTDVKLKYEKTSTGFQLKYGPRGFRDEVCKITEADKEWDCYNM